MFGIRFKVEKGNNRYNARSIDFMQLKLEPGQVLCAKPDIWKPRSWDFI